MHISHLPQLNALQSIISYGEKKAKMCFSCCYFGQFGLLFLCWCSCKSKFHNRNSPKLGKSILLSPLQPLDLRKIGKITYNFVDFYFKTYITSLAFLNGGHSNTSLMHPNSNKMWIRMYVRCQFLSISIIKNSLNVINLETIWRRQDTR